jgi:hypothetical protein
VARYRRSTATVWFIARTNRRPESALVATYATFFFTSRLRVDDRCVDVPALAVTICPTMSALLSLFSGQKSS